MRKLNFEETKELYNFLRGEGEVCEDYKSPKRVNIVLNNEKFSTEKAHLPKMTDEQAFFVIYILQEAYGFIPDTYEVCSNCGELYDADEEGKVHEEENYCDLCYENLGFANEEEEIDE